MDNYPSSVYRLQLNGQFPLKKAIELIPYLYELGIEGVYCSPIFESASPNGYDTVNPNNINPTLGTFEEWNHFCSELQKAQMSLLLDIVPNHMTIKSTKNKWWLDVLEKGPASSYADYFDINWEPIYARFHNKVLLPILDSSYGYALENQKIQLIKENGIFWISYYDYKLPIRDLDPTVDLEKINGKKGDSSSFDELHQLLEKQFYRLAYWRVAGQEINYRRFFNINELVAIHIENEKVFHDHHNLISHLIQNNKTQGLRIDHPDGLYDPVEYFERIRKFNPAFIVVEKILDSEESLPEDWQIDGTTGYDYLGLLNGLFIEKNHESKMTHIYEKFIEKEMDFKSLLYERKKWYILINMTSEISFLGASLKTLCEKNRYLRDCTQKELTIAIQEIMTCFPVYRTYIRKDQIVSNRDKKFIIEAVEAAKQRLPQIDSYIFDVIREILLFEFECGDEQNDFVLRFQQLTAPAMAKGLEDSLFYIYNRLISLNEVGCDPQNFGYDGQRFHAFNKNKLNKWPLGLLATSTHDTKYSEDVRMRINVLSEIPDQWDSLVTKWKELNQFYKKTVNGMLVPEPNCEYYIYQLLVGLWDGLENEAFRERFWSIIFKAIREAGLYTSWRSPNIDYENAVKNFVDKLLFLDHSTEFHSTFLKFQQEIADLGKKNSLSQLLLKIGSCGIVDIYQGNEFFHFAAMDPDNRKPVDYDSERDLKFYITQKALQFRRENKKLFIEGQYYPLQAGPHIIALMRIHENKIVIIAVQRFFNKINDSNCPSLTVDDEFKIGPLKELFTGNDFNKQSLQFEKLFASYPVALLYGELLERQSGSNNHKNS